MELTPIINEEVGKPLYIQLYDYIKQEILNGIILKNEKLPSVRYLSKHMAVSRTTVENAYQQLLAEGYIYSRPQKGYYASGLDNIHLKQTVPINSNQKDLSEPLYLYDFKSEYVEENNFDFNQWKRHVNYVINYEQNDLYTFGHVQGEEVLRYEIAKYVHRTRGVSTNYSHIVIGAGVQSLLNILASIVKEKNINSLAMEDPGFNKAKNIFEHNNFNVIPIHVTSKGIKLKALKESQARLCYVSPSHQFPTGTVMLIDVRSKLIRWADENDGYIIEDDYNSELRYEGMPIPAMKGLDKHDRVIYLGSFSTVLVPSIRISFMILPDELLKHYHRNKHKYAQTASKIEQLSLARMMAEGDFEKHIRKIRKNYSKKNDYTLKLIKKYLKDTVIILGSNSGLNVLLKLKFNRPEERLVNAIRKEGINIAGINEYAIQKIDDLILIVSYRGIATDRLEEGIKKLSEIIKQLNNDQY